MSTPPEFSVLVTCYFEEKSIDEFVTRVIRALDATKRSYELIMVNDGSTDGTWNRIQELWKTYPQIQCAMDFFKNAGQLCALTACMCEARGKAMLLIDSDLQLDPEEIPLLIAEYDKGMDVVSGSRRERHDSLSRIIPSKLANMVMRTASQSSLSDFGCTFKIYQSALLRGLELGPTRIFNTIDAIARASRIAEVPVTHHRRRFGKSGWTLAKLWQFNMDNFVSLSERPFQWLAAISLLGAVLFFVRVVIDYFAPFRLLGQVSNGLLLNGIVISILVNIGLMAMIGEFTLRGFLASRRLPQYIVREKLIRHDAPMN